MTKVQNLIRGYRRFYEKYFASGDTLYQELSSVGQSPKTLIIACSDSRVDPATLTDAEPGDIFVLRNVANLVPPYASGSKALHGVSAGLEFATTILNVEHIIILGHSQCAGIQTLLNPKGTQETDFIGKWVEIAKPARDKAIQHGGANADPDKIQHLCEKEAIQLSLQNLMTFPWIKERVESGTLKLHGWYFSVSDGTMQQYNPQTGNFENV